jgi:hypothetical protein
VGLPEEGRELDDRSRFKITLKLANTVDVQSIINFCKKDKQATQIANTVVSIPRIVLPASLRRNSGLTCPDDCHPGG